VADAGSTLGSENMNCAGSISFPCAWLVASYSSFGISPNRAGMAGIGSIECHARGVCRIAGGSERVADPWNLEP